MYKIIRSHKSAVEIYSERLVAANVVSSDEVEKMKADWRQRLETEYEAGQTYKPNKADWLDGRWAGLKSASETQDDARRGQTAVPSDQLKAIGAKLTEYPAEFKLHRTIQRFLDNRRKSIETGEGIDLSLIHI